MRFLASSSEKVGAPDNLEFSAAIILERSFRTCSLFSKAYILITTMSPSPFLVIYMGSAASWASLDIVP
jgi:hypothetical protein